MKNIFALVFTVFSFYAFGQNFAYFPLNGDQSIYKFQNSYGFTSECTDCVFGYQVNSQAVINGDTIIYHGKVFKGTQSIIGTNEPCLTILDTSWLGVKTIIKTNGDYLFFNKDMDTILLKPYAMANETWKAYDLGNGNHIEGQIVTTNIKSFLGIQDEVKHIRFRAKDSQGNEITAHPFHLWTMQVSKNYGVKKGINFFDFPNDTSEVNLIGQNSLNTPLKHIDRYDIFDFNIGDELHIHARDINFLSSIGVSFEKRVVIGYQQNNGDISIVYDVEKILLYTTTPPVYDTTYTHDTLTINILANNTMGHLDSLPYSFNINNLSSSRGELGFQDFEAKSYGNRIVKRYDFSTGYMIDTCITEIIDGFVFPYFYIEGLGGPYENDFSFNNNSSFRELVYYKKGNTTWGNPFDLQALMPTSTRQVYIQSLSLHPNPAKNFIQINLNDKVIENATIEILNANGQLMYQEQIGYLQNDYQVKVDNLVAGFYILRVRNDKSLWISKFLK